MVPGLLILALGSRPPPRGARSLCAVSKVLAARDGLHGSDGTLNNGYWRLQPSMKSKDYLQKDYFTLDNNETPNMQPVQIRGITFWESLPLPL